MTDGKLSGEAVDQVQAHGHDDIDQNQDHVGFPVVIQDLFLKKQVENCKEDDHDAQAQQVLFMQGLT